VHHSQVDLEDFERGVAAEAANAVEAVADAEDDILAGSLDTNLQGRRVRGGGFILSRLLGNLSCPAFGRDWL